MKSYKEHLTEAFEKKEDYKPEVGHDVRVPGDKVGQTLAGKVKKIGATMVHVEHKDGTTSAHPAKHVFKHDMSDANYSKWNGK